METVYKYDIVSHHGMSMYFIKLFDSIYATFNSRPKVCQYAELNKREYATNET